MLFIYNKKQSDELDIIVISTNHLDRFKKRKEFVQVPGRTGDLVIDDGSYDNLNLEITCIIEDQSNISDKLKYIEKWLETNDYSLLEFSDGSKFNALFVEIKDMKKIIQNVVECKIIFSCRKEMNE